MKNRAVSNERSVPNVPRVRREQTGANEPAAETPLQANRARAISRAAKVAATNKPVKAVRAGAAGGAAVAAVAAEGDATREWPHRRAKSPTPVMPISTTLPPTIGRRHAAMISTTNRGVPTATQPSRPSTRMAARGGDGGGVGDAVGGVEQPPASGRAIRVA
jgi:hypothetical protein